LQQAHAQQLRQRRFVCTLARQIDHVEWTHLEVPKRKVGDYRLVSIGSEE
jgi:hypothetical protein